MRLSILLLLTCLMATSYIVKANEDDAVDAEVIDDDDIEIDDDDDVEVMDDDDDDEDEDEDEPAAAGEEPEEQPQLMPMPLEGVRSFIYFPDGAHTITGGKVSEIVVGVQNNGNKDIEMMSCSGKMLYPQGANEVIQNFTNVGYDKQIVASKAEASFYYAFMPNIYAGGREFTIGFEVYYREANTNLYYRAVPFNETVSILESAEGVATEIFFMYSTVVLLAIVGGFFLYDRVLAKKLGLKAQPSKKKVETGTSNEGVNMDWIGNTHLRKRNTSKQKSN
jgi:hypothetical protein